MEKHSLIERVRNDFRVSSGFVRTGQLSAVVGLVLLFLGTVSWILDHATIGLGLAALGIALLQLTSIAYSRASLLVAQNGLRITRKRETNDSEEDLALIELALQGLEDTIHRYGEEMKPASITSVPVSPGQAFAPDRAFAGFQNAYLAMSKNSIDTLVISSARLVSELKATIDIPAHSMHQLVSYDAAELAPLNNIRRYEQILVWVDPETDVQTLTPFVPYAWVSPDSKVLAGPTTNLVEKFFSHTGTGTPVKCIPTRIREDGFLRVAFERSLEA